MTDNDKFAPNRALPSQARGKERVRLILETSAGLFTERGVSEVSTNDIAEAARIPVGSVYRYFDSKAAILQSLIDLHCMEIADIIRRIAANPLSNKMSWYELLTLLLNAWSAYRLHNKSRSFLQFARSDPKLAARVAERNDELYEAFHALAQVKRGASSAKIDRATRHQDTFLGFHYCRATVEMLDDPHFPDLSKDSLIEAAAAGIAAGLEAAEAENE
jgi:AcrR family transcriptional regulator